MGRFGFKTEGTGQRHAWSLQADVYKGDIGESVLVGSYTPPSQVTLEGNDEVSGGNFTGRWEHQLDRGSLQIQAYYDRNNRLAPHFKETRNTFDVDTNYSLPFGERHNFQFGLGARWSPSRFYQTIPTLDVTRPEKTENIYGAFVQDKIDFVPGTLSLTAGTKFEHNNYTGLEFQPGARLLWNRNTQHTFWAAVTHAVRIPARLESDLQIKSFVQRTPLVYLEVLGNPHFDSERLVGYEMGQRSLLASSLYLDVAVFHNEYDNLSSFGPGVVSVHTSPIPHAVVSVSYVNGVTGRTDGFEITPNWRPTPWWDLKGSYSYLHVDVKRKPGNTDTGSVTRYEGSSPNHRAIIQSSMSLPGNFELDHTYRYVSALPAQRVGAYQTADLRLGWHVGGGFEFSVAGQNLLQPHHAEFGREARPTIEVKRSVYARLTWTK
jgi:iron complex outermembrane receptor protein